MTEKKNLYVRVPSDGKIYKTVLGNLDLNCGDEVLFEYEQYQDTGVMIGANGCAKEGEKSAEMAEVTVIRRLNDKDQETIDARKEEAKPMMEVCQEKIKKHGLSMDLLDAELSYDGKKLTFYFTAPGRIDFRSLVPDLASAFKKLIRLQQVISREKARCFAAIGKCGRELCCRVLSKHFSGDDVTQEMAYEQNLGQMGANRVTGLCGKLQCCLKFELEEYEKANKKMPAIGSEVKTPEGAGKVIAHNVIKNKIKVELLEDQRILEVDC